MKALLDQDDSWGQKQLCNNKTGHQTWLCGSFCKKCRLPLFPNAIKDGYSPNQNDQKEYQGSETISNLTSWSDFSELHSDKRLATPAMT